MPWKCEAPSGREVLHKPPVAYPMSTPVNASGAEDASGTAGPGADRTRREAALGFLFGRIDYERARNVPYRTREFKLQRMRELVAAVGDPQTAMPIVHVAGTKGKGSTAAILGAILSAAGHRTGVFTSPHLERLEERVQIDGHECSPAELIELVGLLRPTVEAMDRQAAEAGPDESGLPEIGPTYFEITTAMALLHFARQKVDAAVLEVGLGGRLDSTNVCRPRVSVITSISYDHTRQLGDTLESIALEKAGIVKPGVPVISGVDQPGPRDVIRRICHERGAPLVERGVDFSFRYEPPRHLESGPAAGRLDFEHRTPGGTRVWRDLALGLLGPHQAANAAVALATLEQLRRDGWRIPEEAWRRGLAEVRWPARVELLARRPAVIIDSAHNPASIDALLAVLDESFSVRRQLLIFAATEEKDVRAMLQRLLGRFDEVLFTRYLDNPRAVPPECLRDLGAELTGRHWPVFARPAEAWDAARARAAPEDLVCVTGSFFIAAEMRRHIHAGPLS